MTVTLGADITALKRAMTAAGDLVSSSARRMRRITTASLAGLGRGGAFAIQKSFAVAGSAFNTLLKTANKHLVNLGRRELTASFG